MKQVSDSLKFTLNVSCKFILCYPTISVLSAAFKPLCLLYFFSFILFTCLFVCLDNKEACELVQSLCIPSSSSSLLSAQGPPILSPLLCHGGHLISRHTTSDKPPGRQFSSDDGELKTS